MMRGTSLVVLLSVLAVSRLAAGDGLPVQYGLLPLGDLTTSDQAGPYNVPDVQAAEVEAAIAAKTGAPGGPFTDADVLNFLANTECLEATFNSFAAFGAGLPASLKPGRVIGGKRAPLTPEVQSWAEEVALDEQGHVRMVRQVLGERSVPCPTLDLSGGFRAYFDAATNVSSSPPFDPFKSDVNFLLATWSLEEIGATGDKGCILLASNPGVSNCIAGLAGAASYQSGVDRHLLWQRRNETVPEYNMTVHQIVEAISNTRDIWDGPAEVDQALYQGNPNFIAVPSGNINLVPTDLRGLTFSRTPQQVLHIVTLGSPTGKGGFFPEGLNGRINSPAGYNDSANAFGGYPGNQVTVLSLAEANRTGLLNNNITNVTAAPLPLQAEASGQQYPSGGVGSSGGASPNVTLIGTSTPETNTSGSTAGQEAGPANTSNTTAGGASSNVTTGTGGSSEATNATSTESSTSGNTTDATVVVVPVTTALNQTSTNSSALNASSPAFTSTGEASPSPRASPSPSPSGGEGVLASPSPDSGNTTGGTGNTTGGSGITVVPVVPVIVATSPAPGPETTTTSPAPTSNVTGTTGGTTTTTTTASPSPLLTFEASPTPSPSTGGVTEASRSRSPSSGNDTVVAAVTDIPANATPAVIEAVRTAAQNASNGTVDVTIGTGPSPSPSPAAGGTRKLRYWRRPAL